MDELAQESVQGVDKNTPGVNVGTGVFQPYCAPRPGLCGGVCLIRGRHNLGLGSYRRSQPGGVFVDALCSRLEESIHHTDQCTFCNFCKGLVLD